MSLAGLRDAPHAINTLLKALERYAILTAGGKIRRNEDNL